MRVMNMSDHPWDTDTGGILAPGESGEAGDSPRVADALACGLLVEIAPEPDSSSPVERATSSPPSDSGSSRPRTSSKGVVQ